MNKHIRINLFLSAIFLAMAAYLYIETGRYTSATISVLICPLVISFNQIFTHSAEELCMEPSSHKNWKKMLNIIRFSIFALGMILFILQVVQDLN